MVAPKCNATTTQIASLATTIKSLNTANEGAVLHGWNANDRHVGQRYGPHHGPWRISRCHLFIRQKGNDTPWCAETVSWNCTRELVSRKQTLRARVWKHGSIAEENPEQNSQSHVAWNSVANWAMENKQKVWMHQRSKRTSYHCQLREGSSTSRRQGMEKVLRQTLDKNVRNPMTERLHKSTWFYCQKLDRFWNDWVKSLRRNAQAWSLQNLAFWLLPLAKLGMFPYTRVAKTKGVQKTSKQINFLILQQTQKRSAPQTNGRKQRARHTEGRE